MANATIARPITNGAGVAITNGAGLGIFEAGLGAADFLTHLDDIPGFFASLTGWIDQIKAGLTLIETAIGWSSPNPSLYSAVQSTNSTVLNADYGLPNLRSQLGAIRNQPTHNYSFADVLAALTPVTLPTPAPITYGGLSAAATADAVWGASDPNSHPANTYGNELWEPHQLALLWSYSALARHPLAPMFGYTYNDQLTGIQSLVTYPQPNWADIRLTDTRLTWLQRTEPNLVWDAGGTGGVPHGARTLGPFPVADWYLLLTEAEFDSLKTPTAATVGAPVWRGAAHFTPGPTVALADALVVAGPLHGVLVNCSSPPPGASDWVVGNQHAYYRWGEVSFLTDHGEAEPLQFLGFGQGLYLPKSMAVASSALFRVSRLPAATVTPFTIT